MTTISANSLFSTDHPHSQPLFAVSHAILSSFKQATRQYALFHIGFCALAFLELLAFVLFFSFFTQTTLFAFSLAGLFLTGFTYFVWLFYLQAKKPQEFSDLLAQFVIRAQSLQTHEVHSSAFLIHALYHLYSSLSKQEYTYYGIALSQPTLSPLLQKFSAWVHWKDLHKMKELILRRMVQEHLALIREYPTDTATHLSLGETYLLLAELYTDPHDLAQADALPWVSPEYQSTPFVAKKDRALTKALEEYKILEFYSKTNIAIYKQLARIYYDLQKPDKAILAYETIITTHPDNEEALFDLGSLYFETGRYAQGLEVYNRLISLHNPRAQELLSFYDDSLEET